MNIPALLIASVVGMGIGALWYSPLLFGKLWLKESKVTLDKKDKSPYLFTFLNTFVTAVVLGQFIRAFYTDPTVFQGILVGAMAGLGLVTPSIATNFLFERKTLTLLLITSLHHVAVFSVIGAIIAQFN